MPLGHQYIVLHFKTLALRVRPARNYEITEFWSNRLTMEGLKVCTFFDNYVPNEVTYYPLGSLPAAVSTVKAIRLVCDYDHAVKALWGR
jgi:hypothetical protein